jgi:hypothetical protein
VEQHLFCMMKRGLFKTTWQRESATATEDPGDKIKCGKLCGSYELAP